MAMRGMTLAVGLFIAAAAAWGQVPITGVSGVNLTDIEGTSTLVTVVLNPSGAEDPNCTVVDVGPNYVSVVAATGERNAYLFTDIREIRVQGEKLDVEPFQLDANRPLNDEDQAVVDAALSQAREMFENATTDQQLRMDAAGLVAMQGDEDALQHLTQLAATNDLQTSLEAILRLYTAGEDIRQYEEIKEGLESGIRVVRRLALTLAGFTGDPQYLREVRRAAEDRIAQLNAPAMIALARIGDRESVPLLIDNLGSANNETSIAAREALVILGGSDVIAMLKERLDAATRLERFRVISTLYLLGDPLGERFLEDVVDTVPTLAQPASIILAGQGQYDARVRITEFLSQRFEGDLETYRCRAEMAGALMKGGDRKSIAVFQDLLRAEQPEARTFALMVIATLEQRNLLTIIRPAIDDASLRVQLRAAQAAVALANPGFSERLERSLYDVQFSGNCDI